MCEAGTAVSISSSGTQHESRDADAVPDRCHPRASKNGVCGRPRSCIELIQARRAHARCGSHRGHRHALAGWRPSYGAPLFRPRLRLERRPILRMHLNYPKPPNGSGALARDRLATLAADHTHELSILDYATDCPRVSLGQGRIDPVTNVVRDAAGSWQGRLVQPRKHRSSVRYGWKSQRLPSRSRVAPAHRRSQHARAQPCRF